MAGARTRTTGALVILALVFIAIIIILCLMPFSTPTGSQYAQNAKSRPLTGDDVLTDEPPPATTTTTTTTTTTATTGATTTPATTATPATTTTTTTPTPIPTSTTTTPSTTATTTTSTQPSTPSTTPSTTSTQSPPPQPRPATTTTSSAVPPSTSITTTTATTPTTESGSTNTTTQSRETTTATERTKVQMQSTTTLTTATTTTLTTTATTAVTTPITSTTESTAATLPPLLTTSPTTTTTQETTTFPNTTTPPPPPPTSTTTATTTTTTATTTSSDSSNSTLESSSPFTSTQTSSAPLSTASEATSPSVEALTTIPATTSDLSNTSIDFTSTSSSSTPSSSSSSSSSMTSPQSEPPATAATCPTPVTSSESVDVCMSPACKTLAARMLDLMDHSGTSPCEDFYQYACGGVTDDLFLAPESQHVVTRRLILDLIKGLSEDDPQLGVLKVFYDSCTSAETESRNASTWLAQVRAVFDAVYSPSDPNTPGSSGNVSDSNVNITKILIGMMKIHFAPFFDLLLDVSDDGTDEFVLMLTPPLLLSPFSDNLGRAVCFGEHLSRMDEALHSASSSYDVNNDYEMYSECMGKGKGLQARVLHMRKAVKGLGLMHHFNYTSNSTQGPEGLLVDNLMDTEFLLGDLYNILPRKPDLRNGHLKKSYEKVPLSYIEQKFMFPNFKVEWAMLVEALLGRPVDPATTIVHLYFENELLSAFEEIDFIEPAQLQRILLLLLAERLYTDLVEPAQHGLGNPEYCLQTSRELLGDLVSSLYVGGLPHIQERQEKIEEMMKATKEAAEKELKSQPSLQGDKADSWLKKLRDMSGEVASPDPSQYLPLDVNKPVLSENFVNNCLILLTRYRSHMYQQYQDRPSSPSILWSHFLMPFSFTGISLYASNKFLMPYTAMEAPLFFWDVPDYINYAGVGHMIAHEVMHGFDGTGSFYNGTHRHQLDNLDHFVKVSECLANQYRSPQSLTAASGLTAKFILGRLPLNEFLADSGAARLAWDAYEHSLLPRRGKGAPPIPATPGPRLPWLDLNPLQLYFLRIAQKHCTPTSNTHMLAIMENEHLPARLRINLVLQNEPLFTEAFSCPAPAHQCPYVLG